MSSLFGTQQNHREFNPTPSVTSPVAQAIDPGGRPSGYTPKRLDAVCCFIRHTGLSDSAAAALAEVTAPSLCRWKKKHEEVQMRLDQARAQFQVPRLAIIGETRLKNGELDWRAQAWLLKFSNPEKYGPPSRRRKLAEVEVPLSEEDRMEAEEALLARSAGREARPEAEAESELAEPAARDWPGEADEKCDDSFRNSPAPAAGETALATPASMAPREAIEKCDESFRNPPAPVTPPPRREPRLSRRERRARLHAARHERKSEV